MCAGVYAHILMCLLGALLRHIHADAREGHPISSSLTVQLIFLSLYLSPNVKLAIWLGLLASELLKSLALCPLLLELQACVARSKLFCE